MPVIIALISCIVMVLAFPIIIDATKSEEANLTVGVRFFYSLSFIVSYPANLLKILVFERQVASVTINPIKKVATGKSSRKAPADRRRIISIFLRNRVSIIRLLARVRMIGTVSVDCDIVLGGQDDPAQAAQIFGGLSSVAPFIPEFIALRFSVDYCARTSRWSGNVEARVVPGLAIIYLVYLAIVMGAIFAGEFFRITLRRSKRRIAN